MVKIWKRVFIILVGIIILILGVAVYLNFNCKSLLTKKLKEVVVKSTYGLYTINFNDITTHILTGTIVIKKIVLKPNYLVYEKLIPKGLAPKQLYTIQLPSLTLSHIQLLKAYFNKRVEINSITLNKPVVLLTYQNVPQYAITKDIRTAYQRLSKYLKSVHVKNIILQDVDFKYVDKSITYSQKLGLKNLTIHVKDLLIDSASQFDKSRFYYTKDVAIHLEDSEYNTTSGNYSIRLKELNASTAKGFIRLDGLSFIPKYSEMEFAERLKVRTDRYTINFKEILLNQINYNCLLTQGRLIASNLIFNKGNITIFSNQAVPNSNINKGKNYPQLALKRLGLPTLINTVEINNSVLNYSEYNPKSKQKGTIFFNQLNGKIYHITNDSLALQNNNYSKADFTALMMGHARINLHLSFNLNASNAAFAYNGNIGRMDTRILNPAIRPLALIEIKSGMLNEMKFSGREDIIQTAGQLTLSYNNLKIALLKRNNDEENSHLKRKGIISLFLNIFIIKADNPTKGNPLRTANFVYKRPANSSFFTTMWKGVLNGMKESIGLGDLVQKDMQIKLQNMSAKKIDRQERREKRKARRSERKRIRAMNR